MAWAGNCDIQGVRIPGYSAPRLREADDKRFQTSGITSRSVAQPSLPGAYPLQLIIQNF